MTIESVICRGQAQTIAEAVEALRAEAANGERQRDLEILVELGLSLAGVCRRWVHFAWDELFALRLDSQRCGLEMLDVLAQAIASLDGVLEVVGRFEEDGLVAPHAEEVRQGRSAVAGLRAEVERDWPLFAPAELEAAHQRLDRGEGIRLEDMLHALDV